MNKIFLILTPILLVGILLSSCTVSNKKKTYFYKKTLGNWEIQNSTQVNTTGDIISTGNFTTKKWFSSEVPETVLHALVQNGVYKNVYRNKNLEKIPTEQFKTSWWYRTQFNLDKIPTGLILDIDGINYKANIWLNGKLIADTTVVINTFRQFKFDIKKQATSGKNTLAIEVYPPRAGDFSMGFVDWNPTPPDRNMGIFRKVFIEINNGVGVFDPFIVSSLNDNLTEATLQASVVVTNYTDKTQSGDVNLSINSNNLSKTITLAAGESKKVVFSANEFSKLKIKNPKLWWPHTMGEPYLYNAEFAFQQKTRISDKKEIKFGIREVSKYFTENGALGYKINGKKILIRGGGWVDKLLLEDTEETIDAQLEYIKDMNLNTVRMEGFWGKGQTIYNLCDEKGLLVMVGWSCQWEWKQYLGVQTDEKYGGIVGHDAITLMSDAFHDQIVWLRNHPAIISWVGGSDLEPTPELEKKYFEIFNEYDSTRVFLASAKNTTTLNGPTGVKMEGPYAYVPPVYWYSDSIKGGAYGFNTETGPGAQVPPLQSLKKMLSPEHLWPIDSVWNYHCGRFEFGDLRRYRKAMNLRYGKPDNLDEFIKKAQLLNYELMRPMFEAFSAYRYKNATGVIQWMLNSAWPEMYWQLYDYYLMPNAAYYGAKVAQRPYHAIYDYYRKSIFVVNDKLEDKNNCTLKIRVFDLNSNLKFEKEITVNLKANSSEEVLSLADLKIKSVSFIDTRLIDKAGNEIDNNFYWISPKADILDYEDTSEAWFVTTPSKQYADFTALNKMPKVEIESKMTIKKGDYKTSFKITLKNKSDKIAFFIYSAINDKETRETVVPVIWSNNYISLLPGETKVLSAEINNSKLEGKNTELVIDGYNLK